MDSVLRALVEAVEAGKPGPPLRILVAGGAFLGTTIPRAVFFELMEAAVASDHANFDNRRGLKRGSGVEPPDATSLSARAQAILEPMRSASDAYDAVNLGSPKWWSYDNKTTLEMPAVRVPFSAINAWWISGETGHQAATWYVGGVVSLPLR